MFLMQDSPNQAQLQRQILILSYLALIEKLLQIRRDIYLLKMA